MFKGILKYAIQNKVSYISIVGGQAPVMKDINQQALQPGMKPMTSKWLLDVMNALFPKETDKMVRQHPILGQLPIPGGKKVMLIAQPGPTPELTVYLLDHAEQECMKHWNQLQQQSSLTPPPVPPEAKQPDPIAPPQDPTTQGPDIEPYSQESTPPPPPPSEAFTLETPSSPEQNTASPFDQVNSQKPPESSVQYEAETPNEAPPFEASQSEASPIETETPSVNHSNTEDSHIDEDPNFRLPPPPPPTTDSLDTADHSNEGSGTESLTEDLPPIPTSFALDEPQHIQQEGTDTPESSSQSLSWDPFGGKPLPQEPFEPPMEEPPTAMQLDMPTPEIGIHNQAHVNQESPELPPPPSFSMDSFQLSPNSDITSTDSDSFHITSEAQNSDIQNTIRPQQHSFQTQAPHSHTPSAIQQDTQYQTPTLVQQQSPITPEEVFQEHLPGQTFSNPETENIDNILKKMVEDGASDLHLSNKMPPYFRISGSLKPFRDTALTPSELQQWLWPTIPKSSQKQFYETWDLDYAYALDGVGRFRFNLFRDYRGVGAVIRQIPAQIPTAQELSLPESILQFCHLSKGLVLVTGPTGSGKSTTLAAMIHEINRTRHDHIITVEDPVEFVHTPNQCLINHREVGTHTASFSRALKAALREDPDIVLVGEMRDLETVEMAIETAETGHLVFGTLHTTTAASTVDRVVNQFPGERQSQIRSMLSNSLAGVVSQVLCPTLDGKRAAAFEVLVQDTAVSNLIRESKIHMISGHMETQSGAGNILMDDSLMKLLQAQRVSFEEAYRRANRPTRFKELAKTKGLA